MLKRSIIAVMLIVMIFSIAIPTIVNARYSETGSPVHAPYMVVDFIGLDKTYDMVRADWKCEKDAKKTYWALYQWNIENGGIGYCGFQNRDGNHVLLLSLWDIKDGKKTIKPTIEYSLDGNYNGRFSGEGTGAQVFTKYNWKVGTWYTMKVEVVHQKRKNNI